MFHLNVFVLPSFLNVFAEIEFWVGFFFITLKMLVFSLWFPLFLMSAVFETLSPLYIKCFLWLLF